MCGAFAAINNPFVKSVTDLLQVGEIETRNIRVPASNIQIVHETDEGRQLADAKWWLLLNSDGKPNYKYATFNSRWDKLYSSPLTKGLFKVSRCIIPASGIIEGQNKKYHYLHGKTRGLALGGIYKTYIVGNETIKTASIITCPGNPQLENINKKSLPLILDVDDSNLIDAWLSPDFIESDAFSHLLTNSITQDLIANKIAGARDLSIIGDDINIIKAS